MCRYWNRLTQMEETRLTRIVFDYDWSRKKDNWCMEMKKIFEKLDMVDIYEQKVSCNLEQVSVKLYELMATEWKNGLVTKPKLRNY